MEFSAFAKFDIFKLSESSAFIFFLQFSVVTVKMAFHNFGKKKRKRLSSKPPPTPETRGEWSSQFEFIMAEGLNLSLQEMSLDDKYLLLLLVFGLLKILIGCISLNLTLELTYLNRY